MDADVVAEPVVQKVEAAQDEVEPVGVAQSRTDDQLWNVAVVNFAESSKSLLHIGIGHCRIRAVRQCEPNGAFQREGFGLRTDGN